MPALRCLFAIVLAAATWAQAGASENLLANPGFEEGLADHPWMAAGWDTSSTALPNVFFGRDSILVHSGSYAISVANASGVWPIDEGWFQIVPVTPDMWGKDLVLKVWTRSIGLEGTGFVMMAAQRDTIGKMALEWGVQREDAERRLGYRRLDDPTIPLGWQRVAFKANETPWVARTLRVYLAPGSGIVPVSIGVVGVGQVFIDDASLTLEPALPAEAPPENVNLIANPGFEDGTTGWEIAHPPFPGYDVATTDEVVHSGSHALRFSGGAGLLKGRAGVAQVFCNRAFEGKRLRLVGYAKAESLLSSVTARLYCHTPEGVAQEVSVQPVSGTTDWTRVTAELDVPPHTYAIWAWLSFASPAKGTAYFDDMSLEVIGPATGSGPVPVKP